MNVDYCVQECQADNSHLEPGGHQDHIPKSVFHATQHVYEISNLMTSGDLYDVLFLSVIVGCSRTLDNADEHLSDG